MLIISSSVVFATGDANITISTSATSNGSWSSLTGGIYTFTPSANSANILNTEIQNRLLGSGFTAGDVTIITLCSGSGSENGDVTTSTTITAAMTTQKTLTITAAGAITINNAINLTGGTGSAGGIISLSGTSGIILNATLTTSGTAPTGGSNATGGAGGDISLTSSSGDISVTTGLVATGGVGGTGGNGSGGAGGNISITGSSVTISGSGSLFTYGGNGPGANGGAGGSISISSTSSTVTIGRALNSVGGNAGSANGGESGGDGGNINILGATSVTITNTITSSGGSDGGYSSQLAGSAGSVTITAGTTISNTFSITTSQGICDDASYTTCGSKSGGSITLTAPSGLTLSGAITSYGNTRGDLTINDGNSSVTSGGANDGQTAGAYTVGNFTKTGTGTFKLGVSNSWTGNTTISDGTLDLGIANILPTTTIVMNGGTLKANHADIVGTLRLTANSTIDLVGSSHTLAFSASDAESWTGGTTLTIKNWTGGYNGTAGTTEIIKTGSSAELSTGKLAQIVFRHPTNTQLYSSTQLSSGQVVPTSTSLPVDLISFKAKKTNNEKVVLSWQTASEINNDYFIVERSEDAQNWVVINQVYGAGNSNVILNYYLEDDANFTGQRYYRLTQVDYDGISETFNIVVVNNDSGLTDELKVYPNPMDNEVNVELSSLAKDYYYFKILSLTGQEIYSSLVFGKEGKLLLNYNTSWLTHGTYFFLIESTNGEVYRQKVIK